MDASPGSREAGRAVGQVALQAASQAQGASGLVRFARLRGDVGLVLLVRFVLPGLVSLVQDPGALSGPGPWGWCPGAWAPGDPWGPLDPRG